jgi:CDP-diacylglycerol---glycerol-3-phosphate 3-phosphatidyltransferase
MEASQVPTKLKIRWGVYALGSFLAIGSMLNLIAGIQGVSYALQWGLQASVIMLLLLISLWRILPLNKRQHQEDPLARFGPGNTLTLIRGALLALLTGFIFLEPLPGIWAWLPACLYLISDLTDFFDGYLARLTDTVTQLGSTLDMNNDALGVLVATTLAFQFGAVPWWYLPFGVARYIFLLGLYLRRRKGLPEHPLQPSDTRRLFAGLQMGFISVMLFPAVGPPATTFAASLFLLPFVGIFVIDYLQVTGEYERYTFWADWDTERIRKIILDWLPLVMRGLAVFVLCIQVLGFGGLLVPESGYASSAWRGSNFVLGLDLIFIALLALGVLNRTTAVLALVATGIQLQEQAFSPNYALLLLALIYILFTGGGKFSLWKPEEWLIQNRPGQNRTR